MDFIEFEATEEFKYPNEDIDFSYDENNNDDVIDNFINDYQEINNEASFHNFHKKS